ncbi:Hypothetical protein D9617_14g075190 [Elsinoe fawcettii]|nr:Hypothetical protein D9617_14g075190 [Elsinoe fawcettii]
MSYTRGHVNWAFAFIYLFFLHFSIAAKTSSKVACQANDATISAIRQNVGAPGDFCKWFNSQPRTSSPFVGVAAADLIKACKCINAKPKLLGPTRTRIISKPTGQSNVKGLASLQKAVADPVAFCKFWTSKPRGNSPIHNLGPNRLTQLCKKVIKNPKLVGSKPTTASPSSQRTSALVSTRRPSASFTVDQRTTLLPSTLAITVKDGPQTSKSSTLHSSSTSTPVQFQGNYETATPASGATPAPTATLGAVPPPGLDLTSLNNLAPAQNQSLFFAGKATNDGNTSIAAVAAAFLYQSVALDHTVYISSISCSGSVMSIQYNSDKAYQYAKSTWKSDTKVILLTSSPSCGASDESSPFLTSGFTFSDSGMTVKATGALKDMADVIDEVDMSFGDAGANTTFAIPACADLPANATLNFPTAPCGPSFDQDLDDKLGYYSDAEADLPDLYGAIAPTISRTKRLTVRGLISGLTSFVKDPVGTTVNAVVPSSVKTTYDQAQAVANAPSSQDSKGQISFGLNYMLPGTAVSPWGRQFLIFAWGPTDAKTKSEAESANKKLDGKTKSGTEVVVGVQVYCVDCGIRSQLDFTANIAYSTSSGFKKANFDIAARVNISMYMGVNAFAKLEYTKDMPIYSDGAPGCSIPGIATIGPRWGISVRGTVAIGLQGQILAGYSWGFPNARTYVDLLDIKKSYSYGWTPKLERKLEAYAEVFLEVQLGVPLEIAFGINIFKGLVQKEAVISLTPGVQARFSYTLIDVSTEGTKKSDCSGIKWTFGPVIDLNADAFNVKQLNLWHWEQTWAEGCIGGNKEARAPAIHQDKAAHPSLHNSRPQATCRDDSGFANNDDKNNSEDHNNYDYNYNIDDDDNYDYNNFNNDNDYNYEPDNDDRLYNDDSHNEHNRSCLITTTTTTAISTTTIATTTTISPTPSPAAPLTCGSNYNSTDRRTWNVNCQTDYGGPFIKAVVVSNMTACIDACSTYGINCRVVVWVPAGQAEQYCYLKSSYDSGAAAPGGLTVLAARPQQVFPNCPAANNTVFQPQSGGAYSTECGIDYLGDDLVHNFDVTSFRACQVLCDNTSGCAGVSWIYGGRYANAPWCALKTVMRASARRSTSSSSYDFSVDSATLVVARSQKRAVEEGVQPLAQLRARAEVARNVAITDISGKFGLLPGADGNVYLAANVSGLAANWVLDAGFVLSDTQDRIFLYFPDLMDAYGASRLRLVGIGSVPVGSRLISWVPIAVNGTTILAAANTVEEFFLPVVCVYKDSKDFKVLLVKSDVQDIYFLEGEGLQHVVTGGVVDHCTMITLTAKGVASMRTIG